MSTKASHENKPFRTGNGLLLIASLAVFAAIFLPAPPRIVSAQAVAGRIYNTTNCTGANFAQGVSPAGVFSCAQPSNVTGNAATATALASAPSLCPAGQTAQGILASGNATGCTAAAPAVATLTTQTQGGNVTVNNTLTQVNQIASLTFPASGGPWRAQVAYHVFFNFTLSVQDVDCYVIDGGSNIMDPMITANSNGAAGGKTNGNSFGWSNVTYANGATTSFTLDCQGATAGAVALGTQPTLGQSADLQVLPVAAN